MLKIFAHGSSVQGSKMHAREFCKWVGKYKPDESYVGWPWANRRVSIQKILQRWEEIVPKTPSVRGKSCSNKSSSKKLVVLKGQQSMTQFLKRGGGASPTSSSASNVLSAGLVDVEALRKGSQNAISSQFGSEGIKFTSHKAKQERREKTKKDTKRRKGGGYEEINDDDK